MLNVLGDKHFTQHPDSAKQTIVPYGIGPVIYGP